MIDKERPQSAVYILPEDSLPIIGMSGADVNHQGQPEALNVSDTFKAGFGENFQ